MSPIATLPLSVRFEHFATTVPDLNQALDFFVSVLGGREVSQSYYEGEGAMQERFGAHPSARARVGVVEVAGTRVELFEFTGPDITPGMPRGCDPGGHHIGLRVAGIEAAAETLAVVPGVELLDVPRWGVSRDGNPRAWVYFLTPWGMQLELIEEVAAA